MLVDNRKLMKEKNSQLFEQLDTLVNNDSIIEVSTSKTGVPMLILQQNNQVVSYHSRYNPQKEAETFIRPQIDEQTEYVLFIGAGLGYHVKFLADNYPKVRFAIYEPQLEIMDVFLKHVNLTKVKAQQFDQIFCDVFELANVERFFDKLEEETTKIIVHPIAQKYFAEAIERFLKMVRTYLENKTSQIYVNTRFQMRWTLNAITNLKEVMQTPSFFNDLDVAKLKHKPALIVSAGPSLNEELERIHAIKEQGSAYIFAVGSAMNVLLNHNILPDALFLYDPMPFTANVVAQIKANNLQIPLIYGSTVAPEVLKDYPGTKIHFITSQDSIAPAVMPKLASVIVPDTSTIASIALFVIGSVQMGPIIFVGQNLSITKEKSYAEGTGHYNTAVTEAMLADHEARTSTTNETIYTNSGYLDMAASITAHIEQLGLEGSVINTTQNGLPIERTLFMSLEEAMATYLATANVVEQKVFQVNSSCDVSVVHKNYQHLQTNFFELLKDYKKMIEKMELIADAYNKKIVVNAAKLIQDYDIHLSRFENNPFFEQVVVQMTRRQYEEFVRGAKKVHAEKMPLKKLERFLNVHPKYIRAALVAIDAIQLEFDKLKENQVFN